MESDEMDQRRSWPWRMKSTSSSSPTDEILPVTTDFSDVGSLSNLQASAPLGGGVDGREMGSVFILRQEGWGRVTLSISGEKLGRARGL
ncbi:hypothetical protein LINPERPRIM_LOCUS13073 [Linum perenne]